MTRLINIDNGGTLTDVCVIDGDEVRYTKTLTTPYDLSRCLFDGLTKVREWCTGSGSRRCCRRRITSGTRRPRARTRSSSGQGPRLGLLMADPASTRGLAETPGPARICSPRWSATGRRPSASSSDDEALAGELVDRSTTSSAGARAALVVSVGGEDGADVEAGSSDCCSGSTRGICSARSRCCSPGSSSPTRRRAPHLVEPAQRVSASGDGAVPVQRRAPAPWTTEPAIRC